MDRDMRGRHRGQPGDMSGERVRYTRGGPSRHDAPEQDDYYDDEPDGRTPPGSGSQRAASGSGLNPRARRGPAGFIRPPLALDETGARPERGRPSDESEAYARASGAMRANGKGSRGRRDDYDDSLALDVVDEPARGRSMATRAREFTRGMSRSFNAAMSRTGRVIRDAGRQPGNVVSPPRRPLPPDLLVDVTGEPYRRSRTRMLARKWRIRRIGMNPIAYATGIAAAILLIVLVVFGGGAGALYATNYYQYHLADIQRLAGLKNQASSEIYDRNGNLLYTVRSGNSGFNYYVPLSQISPKVQWATIDIEDHTFYSNVGINFTSTVRAALVDLAHGGAADQGASTITQQLMKNIVLHDTAKAIQRKINEAILSVGVTESGYYTKAQILEWYLNTIPYGDQNMGVEAAARNFFGLQPKTQADGTLVTANEQLSWGQAALLAGLPNAPTMYLPIQYSCSKAPCPQAKWDNPFQGNPANCGNLQPSFGPEWYLTHGHEWLDYCRAKLVLDNVRQFGMPASAGTFTSADYTTALKQIQDMLVNQQIYHWAGRSDGSAVTALKLAPSFVDYVVEQLATQFGITNLETGGYRIYTTLDLNLNNEIQTSISNYINKNNNNPWYPWGQGALGKYDNAYDGAAIAVDQRNGDILAMVGSANYNSNNPKVAGKVNIVTADRSMGSATKAVVYSTAFQMGWTPGMMMQDIPICFPVPLTDPNGQPHVDPAAPACKGYYVPHDYDDKTFLGTFPLRYMLGSSLNIPATEAMSFVGDSPSTADAFLSMAQRFGITTFKRADMGPTTALGTQIMPLEQLTGAYATIANGGRRAPLRAILKIEGPNGSVLYQSPPDPPTYSVISPQAAYMMTSILTDNNARAQDFGANNPLTWYPENYNIPLAAKTGTSSGSTGPVDIVTVGYSPFMTLGVWFGNANGDPMVSNIIGIAGAGYVFHDVMVWAKQHYNWPEGVQFPIPAGMARGDFNCDTGLAPYKGQKDMTCQFKPYSKSTKNLYIGTGQAASRPDEDWYIQGQAPLQS